MESNESAFKDFRNITTDQTSEVIEIVSGEEITQQNERRKSSSESVRYSEGEHKDSEKVTGQEKRTDKKDIRSEEEEEDDSWNADEDNENFDWKKVAIFIFVSLVLFATVFMLVKNVCTTQTSNLSKPEAEKSIQIEKEAKKKSKKKAHVTAEKIGMVEFNESMDKTIGIMDDENANVKSTSTTKQDIDVEKKDLSQADEKKIKIVQPDDRPQYLTKEDLPLKWGDKLEVLEQVKFYYYESELVYSEISFDGLDLDTSVYETKWYMSYYNKGDTVTVQEFKEVLEDTLHLEGRAGEYIDLNKHWFHLKLSSRYAPKKDHRVKIVAEEGIEVDGKNFPKGTLLYVLGNTTGGVNFKVNRAVCADTEEFVLKEEDYNKVERSANGRPNDCIVIFCVMIIAVVCILCVLMPIYAKRH